MRRAWAMAAAAALTCAKAPGDGPAPVTLDRDQCAGCGMLISDPLFVAEVKDPRGHVAKFDDVGCAVAWLARQPFADDARAVVWVASVADGGWLDARSARFLAGRTSPMGHGFAAVEGGDAGVDFSTMSAAVQAAPLVKGTR